MLFSDREKLKHYFRNKRVAIVGSGPTSLLNPVGLVDSYDLVVRVNNYKLGDKQGRKVDVHYSFYGNSIRKTSTELKSDGVKLCMCKVPNAAPIYSDWHMRNGKEMGINFKWIYERRKAFWFVPTYSPSVEEFLEQFNALGKHIPSTGFSAIWTISQLQAAEVYLTGYDFFSSGIHNVNEPWRQGRPDDPIKHDPFAEASLVSKLIAEHRNIKVEPAMRSLLKL